MGPVPRPPARENGSLPGLHGGGFGPTGVQAKSRATSAACQPGPILADLTTANSPQLVHLSLYSAAHFEGPGKISVKLGSATVRR